MYKLINGEPVLLNEDESKKILDLVYDKNDKDFHYLAFDRQLEGYSPLNVFVHNNCPELLKDNDKIFAMLIKKREACSFYPRLKLTLYPLTKLRGSDYEIDLEYIDKHFEYILELNDNHYKTKFLFVDFGHGASNFNQKLVLEHLDTLLKRSKVLKEIYIEFLQE